MRNYRESLVSISLSLLLLVAVTQTGSSTSDVYQKGASDCRALLELTASTQRPSTHRQFFRDPVSNEGIRHDLHQLPPELRPLTRDLVATMKSRNLNLVEHRKFALAVQKYLNSKGVHSRLRQHNKGCWIDIEGDGAAHFLSRMAVALKQKWHPDLSMGFDTHKLLNELSGRSGSASFDGSRMHLTLSTRDLLGRRLFAPKGGHEIKHFMRTIGSRPQFRILDPKYSPQAEAGNHYNEDKGGFTTEEMSDMYPYSAKNYAQRAEKLRTEAAKLGSAPLLREELERQAEESEQTALFFSKLSAQMYQAAQPRLESVVQADYQQLRVKRLGTDSSAGTMDFDREVMLPNGNKIYFKSTQMNNWYKERHPSEVPRDHSFDREFIREALLEEFSRMSEEMGKIRVVMEKILSRKPLNLSPTTP